MKTVFIDAFSEAAVSATAARVGEPVARGPAAAGAPSHHVAGAAALVGLTGDLQGRLMLDLDRAAVDSLRRACPDERQAVAELAGDVAGRALATLRAAGLRLEATPPMVFSGRNLEVTNDRVETVAVPITLPGGSLVVSLAGRRART